MNAGERAMLAEDVQNEIGGLGPLEPLLADPAVDDVVVNGARRVYVERAGLLSPAPVRFRDDAHLMAVIQRIVSPIGRRVDEATPYVDARLADGSRVNIVIPPVALDGPLLSIRKFRRTPMSAEDYVRSGALTDEMLGFLRDAVRSRLNIVICGGTGSGKTTLLNMLSGFIPDTERLVTIEDAAELQLRQSHVARMETRPATLEGGREISARDLTRNALRMRPDRIILGEVRGAEAVEMLQAMSTGHDGSMATIHANSNRDVFSRLEMLLGFGGLNGDAGSIRRYLARSIQLLIQVQRLENGRRRIVSIAEVTGVEGESYSLNELYAFEEDPPLSGQGEFRTRSRMPFHARRLAKSKAA
jgi:pilus assembly protein CpaF